MKHNTYWMQTVPFAFVVVILLSAPSALAKKRGSTKHKAAATSSPTVPDKKLDISGLENKYWAPKDTDFSVVQNRTYTKSKRFAVSLLTGIAINDTFNSGLNTALTGSYFFSERQGIELSYIDSSLHNGPAVNAFHDLPGGDVGPDFNRLRYHYGVSYTWVPFYAKMSVLGHKIIYFDMAFSPGIGVTNYEQMTVGTLPNNKKTTFTYNFNITQYYFLSRHFAIRFDMRNQWYKEQVVYYKDGTSRRQKNTERTSLLAGVTYFF